MLDGFGRAAHYHHVADLEYRVRARFPAYDAVAPDGADGGFGAPAREFRDPLAARPCMRRQDDAVKLFTECVTVIGDCRAGVAKVLPQHAVAMAAYVVHGSDHP